MNKEKPFNDRRLGNKSRMNREVHVRFREGVGVRFPRATRLVASRSHEPVHNWKSRHLNDEEDSTSWLGISCPFFVLQLV